MADGNTHRSCNIILHDDRVSEQDVLAGTDILEVGNVAYLCSSSTPDLLIISGGRAAGQKEVSLHVRLGTRFGFGHRSVGKVILIHDIDQVTASHLDLSFRDEVLSRPDMWKLTQKLDGQVLYEDNKIRYLNHSLAGIEAIHANGKRTSSALFQQGKTKAILRSGSARYTILVQISREMLEEWRDGDLMFERMIEGYLTDLFNRWEARKCRHEVSIVLFGRHENSDEVWSSDFLHTLHAGVPCNQWRIILQSLRAAFNTIDLKHDISLAVTGSMLEAIHLAAAGYVPDDEAVHLSKPGSSIIVITAGQGIFHAEYDLLKKTTRVLLGNSVGVDIVSLAHKPQHPVPIFQYQLDGREEFALPHWADISYWPQHTAEKQDNGLSSVDSVLSDACLALPILQLDVVGSTSDSMFNQFEQYDEECFGPTKLSTLNSRDAIPDVSTSIESTRTVKAKQPSTEESRKQALPPPLKQRASVSSITTTISLNKQNRPGGPMSLLSNRKISVGPKGLAPMKSGAVTTVSATHASHGKDYTAASSKFMPNEASSDLTKQIRASLNRKASQSSLVSKFTNPEEQSSHPIDIKSTHTQDDTSMPDLADIAEDQSKATLHQPELSSSRTPKAFDGLTSSPQKPSIDPGIDAMTPWLTLANPCNLKRSNMRVALQYRQWQHVFPKVIDSADFKWTSMCTPAALPLYNDLYPSDEELKKFYKKTTRRIVCSSPDGQGKTSRDVLEQLVTLRLTYGFQLVSRQVSVDQTHIFMSYGADYHELQCLSEIELEIIEYSHRILDSEARKSEDASMQRICVRPLHSDQLYDTTASFISGNSPVEWSEADQKIDSELPADALFRMRFVLLPIDPQHAEHNGSAMFADDERRIDGIQRLTQQWQRHRVFSAEDQSHQVSVSRTLARPEDEVDQNPLAIEYHTRDPSALINSQEAGISQLKDSELQIPLFHESEMYHSRNFDIVKLVKQMQEQPPHGVEVRDRRWFAKVHLRCFRGDEMTSWLLGVFKDLHTREEAVEMGNELMTRGLFTHVRYKHNFLDGNYFYQIAAAHRIVEYPNAIASVFNRAGSRSIPATPMSDQRMSPQARPTRGESESSAGDSYVEKKHFMLTQMLMYNVDPERRSGQEEKINLHYDRIHNPENCYHIYIDWRLASPMLVQAAVNRWIKLTEPYGLRLIQVPFAEACSYSEKHPLEHAQYVKLALDPPDRMPSTPQPGVFAPSPRTNDDHRYYHKSILRKLGFVLDIESVDSYSNKIEVVVSAGDTNYSMTQFIHQSGLVIAQISNNRKWDFLLLPNTLTNDNGLHSRVKSTEGAGKVIENVKNFVNDYKALKALYEETSRPRLAAPSPFARAVLANADMDVPPIQLPPHLLNRGI